MVDIETLGTVLVEQTDMAELVGDDGREHSRLPGPAEVQLDHGVTIGLVVPADRPVPAAAAPQGNGRFVGAVETPHAYVSGVDPHHHADPPDRLLDLGRDAGEVRRAGARGRERRLTPVEVYPYRLILRTSVCVSGRTGPRRQADAAGCRPPGR
ncbi:hypothetical protein [Streptomyces sp. DSS69]|uniref:hypothetical protein n=1 Tax=Streptomyces sp. DSS69 TaxID=3113369 RepID=UPI0031F96678